MPEFQINAFKHGLAAGKLQIGLWLSLCSNIVAEVTSDSGFDWLLLDTEHSPNEIPDLLQQLQAVQPRRCLHPLSAAGHPWCGRGQPSQPIRPCAGIPR